MSAFFLFENLEVIDAAKLEEYKRLVPAVVEQYGGRYRVVGGNVEVLEGAPPLANLVMIEFPSVDAARRWYGSAEYRPLKAMRFAALRCNGVLVDGRLVADTP